MIFEALRPKDLSLVQVSAEASVQLRSMLASIKGALSPYPNATTSIDRVWDEAVVPGR